MHSLWFLRAASVPAVLDRDWIGNVIGSAWNVQAGRKVYPLHMGTSDVDGIMLALDEAGLTVERKADARPS